MLSSGLLVRPAPSQPRSEQAWQWLEANEENPREGVVQGHAVQSVGGVYPEQEKSARSSHGCLVYSDLRGTGTGSVLKD